MLPDVVRQSCTSSYSQTGQLLRRGALRQLVAALLKAKSSAVIDGAGGAVHVLKTMPESWRGGPAQQTASGFIAVELSLAGPSRGEVLAALS
jgi:hypothetical protein